MKVVMRLPFTFWFERLNTQGQITPSAFRWSCSDLSLQEPLERLGERGKVRLVVLRRMRVQADDAGFEVDVSRAPMDQREFAALTGNPTHAKSSAKRGS